MHFQRKLDRLRKFLTDPPATELAPVKEDWKPVPWRETSEIRVVRENLERQLSKVNILVFVL